ENLVDPDDPEDDGRNRAEKREDETGGHGFFLPNEWRWTERRRAFVGALAGRRFGRITRRDPISPPVTKTRYFASARSEKSSRDALDRSGDASRVFQANPSEHGAARRIRP